MKYFVSLFLSLFFLVFISCGNEDNAWDNNIPIITSNEQSDSSGLLKSQITDIINYSKINFDENFNNTELYKNLILSPKWENVSMVLQKQDTLHLCVPLLAQGPTLNTIPIIYFKYQISKYYKIYHHWATGKFLEYYKCSYYQSRYYRCRVDSRSYNSWRFMSTNESYLFRSI